jgi:hypothetical protein
MLDLRPIRAVPVHEQQAEELMEQLRRARFEAVTQLERLLESYCQMLWMTFDQAAIALMPSTN